MQVGRLKLKTYVPRKFFFNDFRDNSDGILSITINHFMKFIFEIK